MPNFASGKILIFACDHFNSPRKIYDKVEIDKPGSFTLKIPQNIETCWIGGWNEIIIDHYPSSNETEFAPLLIGDFSQPVNLKEAAKHGITLVSVLGDVL